MHMKRIDIFPWDDNFATGLPKVDEQHRRLVLLLNQLATQIAFDSERIDLDTIFRDLLDYTVYHFDTEEAIWREYLPDDVKEVQHQQSHRNFVEMVYGLIDERRTKESYEVAESTLAFLVRWLASHILETDRHMAYIVRGLQSGLALADAKALAAEQMSGFTRKMMDIILCVYGTLSHNTLRLMRELSRQKATEAELEAARVRAEESLAQHILAKEELARQRRLLKTLIQTVPDLVWLKAPDGAYLACNSRFERYIGRAEAELLDKTDADLLEGAPANTSRDKERHAMVTGSPSVSEEWVTFAEDGHRELLETTRTPMFDEHGGLIGVLSVGHDITERKRTEEALRQAANVFAYANEGIMITDAQANILDVNDAFTMISGYSREAVVGRNPRLLSSGRHDASYYATMWNELLERGHWRGEIWNRHKNGEVYTEMLTISTVHDASGGTEGYVGLFADITALTLRQQRLDYMAHHDVLTGLPNRVLLEDRMQQAIAQADRHGERLAVVYLDLDGFKTVNDTHGHGVGDQVLMRFAERMRGILRKGDTFARLGGDEFVAVLVGLANTESCGPVVGKLVGAAARVYDIEGIQLRVTVSVGVTFYPQASSVDVAGMLHQADIAMYQAKRAGNKGYCVYRPDEG